ncbi:hypothetical protein [Prauserella cavernicola]|uniref:Uncharacterized protein n=1 Tax=Prauserella cavernicola TaxID=2800127 RepID=A0A934QTI2_9PSEU|nr:hypothetical protein [Prauserella cavernicola]MBK1785108.1 hypothetical protein [Prauserella cavernicola]
MSGQVCRKCGEPMAAHDDKTVRWGDRRCGRGMHNRCYQRELRAGNATAYPRQLRPGVEVIEDWTFLAAQNLTRRAAAERMGMSLGALERAIHRHRSTERAS